MPDDPQPAPSATRRVTCEFCECVLDADGAVWRRGQAARAMMDLDGQLATAQAQIEALNADLTAMRARLDAPPTPASEPLPPARARRAYQIGEPL